MSPVLFIHISKTSSKFTYFIKISPNFLPISPGITQKSVESTTLLKFANQFSQKFRRFSVIFPAVPKVRFSATRILNPQQETPFQMGIRGSSFDR